MAIPFCVLWSGYKLISGIGSLSGGVLKQKDTLYSETPLLNTWYVLGLRFYFVKQPDIFQEDSASRRSQVFADLMYRTFYPKENVLQAIISRPEDETMQATVREVNTWLNNHTGFIKILSKFCIFPFLSSL